MTSRAVRLVSPVAAIIFSTAVGAAALAEEGNPALAAAMQSATATLQAGLRASEAQGTPISAKFEIEDGKLQLSVYTMKGDDFMEVVADPKTGAIAKAEKITDADDLNEATEQKAAMARAKVPLLTATDKAVSANAGSLSPRDEPAASAVGCVGRAGERLSASPSSAPLHCEEGGWGADFASAHILCFGSGPGMRPDCSLFDVRHAAKGCRLHHGGSSHDVEKVSDELRGAGIRRGIVRSGDCGG